MTQHAGDQDRSEPEEILAWLRDLTDRIFPLEEDEGASHLRNELAPRR